MPDSMFVDVQIGGEISPKSFPEILRILDNDFFESLDMPTTTKELMECNGRELSFSAECRNYTDLLNFCKLKKLTCTIEISPDTDWNRGITYTHNGSNIIAFDKDDTGQELLFYESKVKPIIKFLVDYAELGITAFPLHIEDKEQTVAELAKKGLMNTDNFCDLIKDKVEELFPEIPEVPPFIIKKE